MSIQSAFRSFVSNRAVQLAAAFVLVACLIFLAVKTRGTDEAVHTAMLGDIRALKQIDAEWNAEVLRARTGLTGNYDPIANSLATIQRLQSAVGVRAAAVTGSSEADSAAAMSRAFDQYFQAMTRKAELIEQFKSQNAILRNSTRFLPVAAGDLSGATSVGLPQAESVASLSQTLLAQLMTYVMEGNAQLLPLIDKGLTDMRSIAEEWPAESREAVEVFDRHARSLLRHQAIGNELLGSIDALGIASLIDGFTDKYLATYTEELARTQAYRRALLAYTVFLLLIMAGIAWRLVHSLRRIHELREQALKKANVQLNEAQVQLVQSAKMSALGQMVAGIAHEINTPLAFVKSAIDVVDDRLGQLDGLLRQHDAFLSKLVDRSIERSLLRGELRALRERSRVMIDDDLISEATSLLKDGSRGIEQISDIVLNLKNFSRLDRSKVVNYDLREGIESTLKLARNLLKGGIVVEKHFATVPKVQCAPSQINQVLLNIISNAAQAMDDKGIITIRLLLEGASAVRIDVADTGPGIDPKVMPKIFDPFFTTKAVGKGTGMGLSISYKIVEEHGGRIHVDSELGIGTVFSVTLPIRQAKSLVTLEDVVLAVAG